MFVKTKPASRRASQVEAGIARDWPRTTFNCRPEAGGGRRTRTGTDSRRSTGSGQPSRLGISTLRHAITVRAICLPRRTREPRRRSDTPARQTPRPLGRPA